MRHVEFRFRSCAAEAQGSAAEALPAVLGDQDGVDAVEPRTHSLRVSRRVACDPDPLTMGTYLHNRTLEDNSKKRMVPEVPVRGAQSSCRARQLEKDIRSARLDILQPSTR